MKQKANSELPSFSNFNLSKRTQSCTYSNNKNHKVWGLKKYHALYRWQWLEHL